MKRCAPYALFVLLFLITLTGFSQSNTSKPKQFSAFPDVINCSETELGRIFNSPAGQFVSLSFSDNFIFRVM
ncbi:MAG: hypothetical protein IPO42_07190 [Chitinophagaceae bacterium]|nr:hypothetical protein [Chitinophagaceae bacterium]